MKAPARAQRQCPVPFCDASLRQGYLMCGSCWSRVPQALKRAVNAAWRNYRSAGDVPVSRRARRAVYDQACGAAIVAAEAGR